MAPLLPGRQLLWFLIPTGSYEFRLLLRAVRLGLLDLLILHVFFNGRQEWLREVRQLGFLFRRKRFDEVRRDDHQQLVGRFLGRAAAEELPQNRDISQAAHLGQRLRDAIIDQAGDGEALPILENYFCFRLALRERGNQEALQRHGIGKIERADFRRDLQIDAARRTA